MSLRTALISVVIGILIGLAITANAEISASKIHVVVKEAPGPDYVNDEVLILGAFDNGDKTSTLQIKACGALISMTVPNDFFLTDAKAEYEFQALAEKLIEQACTK
jgi:hypothetical protein